MSDFEVLTERMPTDPKIGMPTDPKIGMPTDPKIGTQNLSMNLSMNLYKKHEWISELEKLCAVDF